MSLSEQAKKQRREYMRKWREQNRERYNESMRVWKKRNPEKVKEYNNRYWNKKAAELERGENIVSSN